ncbi:SDR family NAD(P)-dependent oxidoreductase [Lysobacter sp. CFH 32150]|uniref:SDR family NAD(P)-dependent oxidoreductase n=1 Tax=Lysobacter sp. CFH 32150 TaxID=2927128 RepID=UPI001FA7BFF9|nr:SDR family NAD(P)-dependent oxidoreductase [Lysobacter sp. CFH 32150]MCI4567781.1 SDR family oxidoreductase [Lysobacter sp. CFH 32150]
MNVLSRSSATQFAARECRVFGTVRGISKTTPVPGVELVEMDVRDDASVHRAIQFVIDQAGRIDVLINSAGANLIGAVEETTTDEAAALFDTNVFGIPCGRFRRCLART